MMRITFDVGDVEHLRLSIKAILSDPKRLKRAERKARFPHFETIGVIGGWDPSRIVVNLLMVAMVIAVPSYLWVWESVLFVSIFRTYGTESGRRTAFMERSLNRVFKAEPEERWTRYAEIILGHENYFEDASLNSVGVGGHFRRVKFMNTVESAMAYLPATMYLGGVGSLFAQIVLRTVLMAYLAVGLLVGALPMLALSTIVAALADERRRHIPPVVKQEDVEVAIGTEREAAPDAFEDRLRTNQEDKNTEV